MATRIKLRRDTATRWQNINPVLSLGEPGVETDTGKMKIGDGIKTWNTLDYFAASDTDANTTYGISAETATGGVNLRLTGSDASTDNVKLAAGANVTLTRTDANTITIASTGGGGGNTGNVTFDGVKIIGDGTASGDGNGYSTLELVPDNSLYNNDQYLVVDPTGPNHIHIRAGGPQDDSDAELFLGGEKNYLRVRDNSGNVRMQTQALQETGFFTFNTTLGFSSAAWQSDGNGGYQVFIIDATPEMYNAISNSNSNSNIQLYDGTNYYTVTSTGMTPAIGAVVFGVVEAPESGGPINIVEINITNYTLRTNYAELNGLDFTVNVYDDVRITGSDVVSIRNRSTTDPVTIITDYDDSEHTWAFEPNGDLTLPQDGGIVFDRADTTIRVGMGFHIASGEGISLDAIDQTAILTLSGAGNGPVNQTYNKTNDTLYTGNDNSSVTVENLGGTWFVFIDGDAKYTSNDLIGWALSTGPGPVPVGVFSNGYKIWGFSPTGTLTFPDGTTNSGDTVVAPDVYDIQSIGNTLIQTSAAVGAKTWTFSTDGSLEFPAGYILPNTIGSPGQTLIAGGQGSVSWANLPSTGDNNIWVQTFESQDGAPTDVVGIVTSVEYDSTGNVIALFSHSNDNDNNSYYSVGKYTTTGTKIWTARFEDGFQTDGWGLAVDNDSNSIYVAGQTLVSNESGYDVSTLTKLDSSDGSIIWSKTYDFGFTSQSAVVDVDSDGNPIMVGYASNGNDNYITTNKVDPADGTIIWSRALDGQNDDEAFGMAVGPTGEVVAVGYMGTFGVQNAAATLYTEPASNPLWTVGGSIISLDGVTADYSFTDGVPTFTNVVDTVGDRLVDDVIVTVLGDDLGGVTGVDDMVVKVATLAANDTDDRMIVVKYDSTGTIQWQKAIQFDAGFDCRGADADIDSDGNIYVTGSYQYDSGEPFDTTSALSILKLDSTGVKQWSRRVTGNCETFGVSVVVGADDKLYLSGVTGFASGDEDVNDAFNWVAAKYGIDGTVEWQRLIDNTTGWSFTGGIFFGEGGGSNIAVKDGYVVLGGGFGLLIEEPSRATVVQVAATGDVFSVGDWDFKPASFSGVLNSSASDITVVNAGKTDTDNAENITTNTVTLDTEVSNFLIGTLYSPGDTSDRLVNGEYEVVLGSTGTITFPGGASVKDLLGETLEESVLILGAGSTIAENQRAARIGLNGAVSGVSIGAGTYDWSFTNDGSLTIPGGISSIDHLNLDADYDGGYSVYIGSNHPTAGMIGGVVLGDTRGGFVQVISQKLIVGETAVPTHSTGAVGDVEGQVAFDSNYIYYCTANYNQVGHQVTGSDYLGRGSLNTNAFQLTKTADTLQITVGDVISDSDGGATSTVVTVSSDENYTYVGTGGMAYSAVFPLTFTSTDYVPGGNIWKRVAWGGDTW